MKCSFYFEVIAPKGLEGIEKSIEESGLGLYVYKSGFNDKNILKNTTDSIIELGMDTSTTDTMYGSGYINSDFEKAKEIIGAISDILKVAGFRHKIGVDDENGDKSIWINHI